MVRPVGYRSAFAGQARKSSLHQIAERLAGDVDVALPALDEVHRHPERIVDVTFESHARLERPWQHAGAVRIGVAPDLRAERQKPVALALAERRIGEYRGGNRMQRQRDTE